jgi:hypothetical protein
MLVAHQRLQHGKHLLRKVSERHDRSAELLSYSAHTHPLESGYEGISAYLIRRNSP